MKLCTQCKCHKHKELFHKNSSSSDGYSYECKSCASSRHKQIYKQSFLGDKKQKKLDQVKQWGENNPKSLWVIRAVNRAKRRAKAKGVPCTLTTKTIFHLVPDKCPVYNTPFVFAGNEVALDTSPSVDRIDPKKGYTPENIVIISVKANRIKSAYNSSDLMKVALWLKDIEDGKS